MKKIVIILLTVLPIFLIVVISFAGRIFSEVSHINVEKVEFVDNTENPYSDKYVLQIGVGETHQLLHKVYPELATNKKVTYTSSDETICTVDQNGLVTAGNKPGTAYIVVKTDERGMTDRLTVVVSKSALESITIYDSNKQPFTSGQISVGESIQLSYVIEPYDKDGAKWESSNNDVVTVDNFGKITAISPGTAVITVVANLDATITASCVITVDDAQPKLGFNFDNDSNFEKIGVGYTTNIKEFNLNNYIVYDSSIVNPENISMSNISGPATYDSTTGMVSITGTGIVHITITLTDGSGISVSVTLLIQ